MSIYRRTIITLDDTQTKIDYMLFCVFERLWPDMISPNSYHKHPKGKNFNNDNRFDICVHVDEINIEDNVEENPLPHVTLMGPVQMLWGDMRRDPDFGNQGFIIKKGHYDIDSVADMLTESKSVQQIWAWFDLQRKMYNYLGNHDINLDKIGSFTQKHLGINLAENPLHIGCIYVVEYSPIKAVHIEAVPMIPALRCEIDWRYGAVKENVHIKVTEKVIGKQSISNEFIQEVKTGETFVLVKMSDTPKQIDIDIENATGEIYYFLRNVAFIGAIISPISKTTKKGKNSLIATEVVGLEHYLRPAILKKEAKDKRARMEFVYFDGDPNKKLENKKVAMDCVKELLGRAKNQLIIADPYFALDQFIEYIVSLANKEDIKIIIVNCKEQLETVAHGKNKSFQDIMIEIKAFVTEYNEKSSRNQISVYSTIGQGRLHDRFILTENEGWLIGSSLSEFGNRACCIIKLSDSAHMELNLLIRSWCEDRNISYKIN